MDRLSWAPVGAWLSRGPWTWGLTCLLLSATLRAETLPSTGAWQSDRVKMEIHSEAWAPACGPKPQGHGWKVSADRFELFLQGQEFVLRSRRRTLKSDGCEGKTAKIRRVGHEIRDGVRTTRCQAPEVNGQAEEDLRHAFKLIDADHLLYVTEGTRQILPPRPKDDLPLGQARGAQSVWYSDGTQWKKGSRAQAAKAQRCVLRLRREEKLQRVVEAERRCSTAGPARRLTLAPKTLDLAPGGRHCFKLEAFDIDDCPTALPHVELTLSPAELGRVDDPACVTLRSDLHEAAALALSARALVLKATALIRVTPGVAGLGPGDSPMDAAINSADARVDTPDLQTLVARSKDENVKRAARELIGGVGVRDIVMRTPVAQASSPTQHHRRQTAQTSGSGITTWLLLALGILGLAAAALWIGLQRRGSARASKSVNTDTAVLPKSVEAPMAARAALPDQGQGLVCPKCHFEFEGGRFCPYDREKLVPLERDARHTMFIPQMGGMICPVCQTRYPTKARFCGKDRSPLMPDLGDSG